MEKKIRICFLYESVFTLGGVQTCITTIANYLIKKGYDITILCTNLKVKEDRNIYGLDSNIKVKFLHKRKYIKRILYKISNQILKLNRRIGIIKNNLKLMRKIYYFYYGKDLEKIIDQEKFDIVISSGPYFNVLLSLLNCKNNIKKIGWQHNSNKLYFDTKGRIYWNQGIIVKEMLNNLDRYIVLTEYDRNELLNKGYNVMTLYNPLRFKQNQKSKLCNKKFIAVGRLNKIKGFDRLIKNFKRFTEYNKGWSLEIFGEGEERDNLISLINELELNQYVTIRHKTNKISDEYKNASIYCMTSNGEGLPMVILEAMESGLPIIAYKLPCLEEIMDSNEGILINQDDDDEYIKSMLELAEDIELRKYYASNGIKRVKNFSIETIGKQWEKLLQEVYRS